MKTQNISNHFNTAILLIWRGIAYRTCSCTCAGDTVHQMRVTHPEIRVRTLKVDRESVSDIVCRGTIEVNFEQFSRILRDAGIKVRRVQTSHYRDSAVMSTVIK